MKLERMGWVFCGLLALPAVAEPLPAPVGLAPAAVVGVAQASSRHGPRALDAPAPPGKGAKDDDDGVAPAAQAGRTEAADAGAEPPLSALLLASLGVMLFVLGRLRDD